MALFSVRNAPSQVAKAREIMKINNQQLFVRACAASWENFSVDIFIFLLKLSNLIMFPPEN